MSSLFSLSFLPSLDRRVTLGGGWALTIGVTHLLGTPCPRVPDQLDQSLGFKDIPLPNCLESLAYTFSLRCSYLDLPQPIYLHVCDALRTQEAASRSLSPLVTHMAIAGHDI